MIKSLRAIREESWDSLRSSETSDDAQEDNEQYDEQGTPRLYTVGDVQRALHPLQAQADRVGRQVEEFAETLDRMSARAPQTLSDCSRVLPLVQKYEKIAGDTVARLKRRHDPELREELKQTRKQNLHGSDDRTTAIANAEVESQTTVTDTTLKDLQHWEQERQTWQLFGLMLQVQYPPEGPDVGPGWETQDERFKRPSVKSTVHRYSSEGEVWHAYLATDDAAWEKHVIVEWLKSTADSFKEDIDDIVEQLDTDADRGSGLHAHGWLYTKEAIKQQKRLRSWPQPLDPASPGISSSLVSSAKTIGLVTQLDPDAFSRQGRSLEEQDVAFERATWLGCWEMIRRGRSWSSIREWCQGRVEGWRALSIRGDPRFFCSESVDDPSKVGTWPSRVLWRATCRQIAQNGGIDSFEAAVYGVLGGDLSSVEQVCRGWDDQLFAHLNSQLLLGFDAYILRCVCKHLSASSLPGTSSPTVSNISNQSLVDRMLEIDTLKEEAMRPMKMLQGSLLSRQFNEFVHNHGALLFESLYKGRARSYYIDKSKSGRRVPNGPTANLTIDDHDLLRILTHMILILQNFVPEFQDSEAVENIVVAYIDYLGKAGKQQLLPLYASRLSEARAIECLARQLPFIIDPTERQTLIRLMRNYQMDIRAILFAQLELIMCETEEDPKPEIPWPRLRVLEPSGTGVSAQPAVRSGFIGQKINDSDHDMINAMEWFLLVDGHWEDTVLAGSIIYKHFLHKEALAAAREFFKRINFSSISLQKTNAIFGRATDLSDATETVPVERGHNNLDALQGLRSTPGFKRHRSYTQREVMLSHAKTFQDLEDLIATLDALEGWKEVVDAASSEVNLRRAKSWKQKMSEAHEAVVATIQPLLRGWLQYSNDESEAVGHKLIRIACLPEIVLAYNTVLSFGGHSLSRDILLKCMDLAATVADEDSGLTDCFIEAGRMAELVDSMAIASKSILRAEELGAKGGRRAGRINGEALDIWTIKP